MSDTNPKIQSKPKKSKKNLILKSILVLFLLGVVSGVVVVAKIVNDIKISTSDFDRNSLISKSSSVMSYYDPTTEEWIDFEFIGTESTGTRNNVYYEDLPQVLVDAVIATEDSRFYKHNGIDLPRITKAALSLVTSREISSGGSTITQQLIKNAYYLSEEHKNTDKWERKIGEILLALDVEKKVSKEDILVNYLNMIQFGYGLNTLGVSAASNYYFDKDVQELTLPEAALLAGVLNQPSKYDPYYNLAGATERRNLVLELMHRHGYISEAEKTAAQAIPVENYLKKNTGSSNTTYTPYQSYYDNVLVELKELGINPYEESIRVYTNMDVTMQEYVESIANGSLFTWDNNVLETSMTLVETHTGKVLCTLGGREYVGVQNPYDTNPARTNRTRERHQPGSSLKPIITYAKAFDELRWSTGQYISNETYMNYGIPIHNWDGHEGGDISLTEALKLSYNNPAMYTTKDIYDKIGANGYADYLESFGFDMSDQTFDIQYSIGGWTHGVTTAQSAGAYAAISNDGTYIAPHYIYKIEYLDNKTKDDLMVTDDAITAANESESPLSPEACFMIREVMRSYSRERYTGLNIPYNVCAKSGTTNYDDALCAQVGLPKYSAKDSLMNAFTEDYAVSVWVGYDTYGQYIALNDAEKYYAGISAGAILNKAHSGHTEHEWHQPSGVVQSSMVAGISNPYVQPFSGVSSEHIISAWFMKDNTPESYSGNISVPSLESFHATYDEESKKITVEFPEVSGSEDKRFGKIVYVAEVNDGVNTKTVTSKEAKFTIDFEIANPTSVTGYYARSKASFATSNKITVDIHTKSSQNTVYCSTYTINAFKDHSYDREDILKALGVVVTYKGEEVSNDKVYITGSINLTKPGTYSIRIGYEDFISDSISVTVTDDGHAEEEHDD